MTANKPTGRRIILRRHPEHELQPSDFDFEDQAALTPDQNQFLVRNLFISVDPMLRLFIDAAPLGGLLPSLPLRAAIPGPAVGEIIESRLDNFAVGDLVEGRFGWQDYALSDGTGVRRVAKALGAPENALGVGGLPGFTAYVGLNAAGGVKPGQTFLVSGAAGAVGSVVGPLIRARGGRAVGIVSGEAKKQYLIEQAGYAAAADRTAPDFLEQLQAALPQGADVYFDNVGGPMLAAMMPYLARGALVLISGLMAQYQGETAQLSNDNLPAVLHAVMAKGIRIQSFTQFGQDAQRPAFEEEIAKLLASGQIKPALHIEEGLERLPHAMCGLFKNSVPGKVIVRTHNRI
jgi:NADPH-dependent curcumin reductase CurA